MGYSITMEISNLYIPEKNVEAALKAINDLHKSQKTIEENAGGSLLCMHGQTTVIGYSWVNNPPVGGFTSLKEALASWRYEANEEAGDYVIEYFTGEKLGNCNVLWNALAPFVNPEAEIVCHGEDGAFWKHIFQNGELQTLHGRIIFE